MSSAGTLSPLGRWRFDRSSWVAVLGEPRQAKDAHEGPLVDETSERHLGYRIGGDYRACVTGRAILLLYGWWAEAGTS
jgi:hypothetical protein